MSSILLYFPHLHRRAGGSILLAQPQGDLLQDPSWPQVRKEQNKMQMSSDVYWLHLITIHFIYFIKHGSHLATISAYFSRICVNSMTMGSLAEIASVLAEAQELASTWWIDDGFQCSNASRNVGKSMKIPLSDMFTRPTGISLEVSWKYPGEQRVPFNSTSKRLKRSYSAATCAATLSNRTFRCWNQFCYEQDQ